MNEEQAQEIVYLFDVSLGEIIDEWDDFWSK